MRVLLLLLVAAALLAALGSSWLQRSSGRTRWLSSLSSSLSSSLVLRARGNGAVGEGQIPTKTKRSAFKSTEAQLNPHNYSRTMPMKPFGGESKFEYDLRALLLYNKLYGNMLVHSDFQVPWSLDWPQEFWSMHLGGVVIRIRAGILHNAFREELEAVGFDYNPQALYAYTWDIIELALRTYRQLHVPTRKHAKWSVAKPFVVPTGNASWPEATWGVRMGEVVCNMRQEHTYKRHRPEAEALGLDYAPQPKGKSAGWEVIKATLQVYRAKYGDLLVPARFRVPEGEPWPEDMWGKSLGRAVNDIRNNGMYAKHRAELEEMNFYFGSQEKSHGWEVIKATLLVYNAKYGDLLVRQSFKVPDEEPWPEDMWGKGLGSVVHNIRSNGAYAEHRAELEEMGFDFSSQRRGRPKSGSESRSIRRCLTFGDIEATVSIY